MEACVAPGAGGSSLWRREVRRGTMGHKALSFLERACEGLLADCVLLAHGVERAGLSTLGGTLDSAGCRLWRACGRV